MSFLKDVFTVITKPQKPVIIVATPTAQPVQNNTVFRIENVEWFSQRDNMIDPYVTCYPTSMAMAMNHCLKLSGLTKEAVGCPANIQLEDYISQISESAEVKQRIQNLVNSDPNNKWMLNYKPRVLSVIEEFIFNKLMNQHGYKVKFNAQLHYNDICNHIQTTKLPIVLHGNFKSVSAVEGHITCCVGFDKTNEKLIILDPYGDCYSGYSNPEGAYKTYSYKQFYIKEGNVSYGQLISKI